MTASGRLQPMLTGSYRPIADARAGQKLARNSCLPDRPRKSRAVSLGGSYGKCIYDLRKK